MTGVRRFVVRALVICGTAFVVLILFFLFVYRPWQLNWGATEEEIQRSMPGDEIVADPTFNATRAVTIEASPEQVWPWLVQMGYLRAGFYSHDWLDNDGVPSAEVILPQYQGLAAGDSMPLTRGLDAEVRVLEPPRFLLLVFGSSASREASSEASETPYNLWTWSWGLYETDSGHTRLVSRLHVRMSFRRTLLLDLFEIVMMRKHLLGIKRRAEAMATAAAAGAAATAAVPAR